MSRKGTSKSNGRKDQYDRFYTDVTVADSLVKSMLTCHPEYSDENYLFCEPSAGQGSFVKALEDNGINNILAFDIVPSEKLLCDTPISGKDFLTTTSNDMTLNDKQYDKGHIIFVGNPPFGVQGNLSIAFVNHCLELGGVVWLILPPTFRKESYLSKIPRGVIETVISPQSYDYSLPDGGTRKVPSSFIGFSYVVSKPAIPSIKELVDTVPFITCKQEDAQFSIRRVGGTAGTASTRTDVSTQSNYMCRVKDDSEMSVDDIIATINRTDFPERDWSVGPRSISKRELLTRLSKSFSEIDD